MDKRTRWAVGLTFGIPLTCLGSVVLALNSYASSFDRAMEADVVKLKAHGFPTEIADIQTPKVADEENAAPLYRAFEKRLEANKDLKKAADLVYSRWQEGVRPEQQAAVQKALLDVEVLIPEVEAIARRPRCDFQYDYSKGFNLLLPEFSQMRRVSNILRAHAERQDSSGDWKAALVSLRLARNFERHLAEGPFLIGVLVQVDEGTRGDRALAELVYRHRNDPAFLAEAAKLADEKAEYPNLRRALGTEYVCCRISIRQMKKVSEITSLIGGRDAPKGALDMMDVSLVRKIADARLAKAYAELEPGLAKDPRDWQTTRKSLKAFDEKLAKDTDPLDAVNQILFPVFANSGDAVGRWECSRTLLREGIRLYREANGKPITNPELPIDPFTGKPFRFRKDGDGFVLYSVGANQVDDSGGRKSESDDTAVRFGPVK